MKRTLTGLVATAVVLGTGIPVSFASSTSSQWFAMSINVNGSTLSTPYGIAESDGSTTTTYIPLFYVNQALSKIGYKSSWNGSKHTWSLTTSQKGLHFSSMPVGHGNTSIEVNGTLVKQVNTVVNLDPNGGASTTYVPIYYIGPIIKALGISSTWNGTKHTWTIGSATASATHSSGTSSSGSNDGNTGSSSANGGSSNHSTSSTSGSSIGSDSGSSSGNSSTTNATLSSPTLKVSSNTSSPTIDVTNGKSGAIITLYDSNGHDVISTTTQKDGTATFYNVSSGTYFAVEQWNGQHSGQSNSVTVSRNAPSSKLSINSNQSNGVWYISVNDAVPSSNVALYSTNGSKLASTSVNSYGYATFNNVPSGSYYVIESSSGKNVQSKAITIDTSNNTSGSSSNRLSTPSIAVNSSNGTLTVNGVQSGATVKLYNSGGSVYESVTANNAGEATFNNVGNGTFYAVQEVDGTQSNPSNNVEVQQSSSTPNISKQENNGSWSIYVSNVGSGETVTLYNTNGATYGTQTASTSRHATFNNVPTGTYYAVQTSSGHQSAESNRVSISTGNANTPKISVSQNSGVGTIEITNVSSNATVRLYQSNGSSYAQMVADSSGDATFRNVARGTYYAVQVVNGSQSSKSNQVTVNANSNTPNTPNAYMSHDNGNNTYTITVNNVQSGSTVTLYTSSGSEYRSETTNSSGYATFTDVSSGDYYAIQKWNGYESARSSDVTLGS